MNVNRMFNPLRYYELHEHLANEHGLVLLESQLEDIILICKKLEREVSKKITVPVEIDVPDGHEFDRFGKGDIITALTNIPAFYPIFKPTKPAKKVIDLSCIVGSGIDCDFSDEDEFGIFGKLKGVTTLGTYEVEIKSDAAVMLHFRFCRIRQSPHVHWWKRGEECPLPEGLEIKVYFIEASFGKEYHLTTSEYSSLDWEAISGFEVLGVAEGWRYEWEEECKE